MTYSPFTLTSPCKTCPFRIDREFYGLAENTIEQIAEHLHAGGDHLCHQTTPFDEDGNAEHSSRNRACAGARATQEAEGIPSRAAVLMDRMGIRVAVLDEDPPVYDSVDEWVEQMKGRSRG